MTFSRGVACALLVAAATACRDDSGCSLNGVCVDARCDCDAGWVGPTCATLDLAPAPAVGAYGYAPNISSWGANVFAAEDGAYHMLVEELWNGCGIRSWTRNAHVVHATAAAPEGPFAYADTALPPFGCRTSRSASGTAVAWRGATRRHR